MRLLNDEALCNYVNNSQLVKGLKIPVNFDKDSPVQPSSIDLHIGSIYIPGTKLGEPGAEDKPLTAHTLGPGETAVVTTFEVLSLPDNIAAVGFPPSRVSNQGVLLTNPGHVDPGYEGAMHFAVINMGRQEFCLKQGGMIVTLLFFEMSPGAKYGFATRVGASSAISQERINKLSGEFLDVTERAEGIAKKHISEAGLLLERFKTRERVIVAVMTILVALAGYVGSVLTGATELKSRVQKLEDAQAATNSALNLDRRLTMLEARIASQATTPPSATQPSENKSK
jgi:dCTP deaminase